MLAEVLATLGPQDGATYLDATFGGGGYARSLWGGGTFYTQTVTIVIGAGGASAVSTGANGRVYINWG